MATRLQIIVDSELGEWFKKESLKYRSQSVLMEKIIKQYRRKLKEDKRK